MSLEKELDLDKPFEDVRHEAVLNVVQTASLLTSAGTALFREYDLTVAQFNVLFALKFKRRAITQSDLSKRLVVTRASITSVLDKLEGKGLVERQRVPDNRRIYHVALTRRGRKLIDTVEPVYREAIRLATGALDDRTCRGLIRQLERVRTRVHEEVNS